MNGQALKAPYGAFYPLMSTDFPPFYMVLEAATLSYSCLPCANAIGNHLGEEDIMETRKKIGSNIPQPNNSPS